MLIRERLYAMFMRKIVNPIWNIYFRYKIQNRNFSIISSNCLGGAIYQDLRREYLSPTVGLFFYAPCFLKFVKELKFYIEMDLTFISTSKYEDANLKRKSKYYPIGKLGDIEIHFLHYVNEEEALSKWNKRKARIDFNNLYFIMTDRDLCTSEIIEAFESLPYSHKVLFSSKPYPMFKSVVYLSRYKTDDCVGDLYNNRWDVRNNFDIISWLKR